MIQKHQWWPYTTIHYAAYPWIVCKPADHADLLRFIESSATTMNIDLIETREATQTEKNKYHAAQLLNIERGEDAAKLFGVPA